MSNEDRDRFLYKYPNSDVLRNKLGLIDGKALADAEIYLVSQRVRQGVPTGDFGLSHLQGIHKHLFQDVYDWAGQIRQVEFSKGDSGFHPKDRIEMAMADVQKRLASQQFLRGLSREDFAKEAAEFIGDVNRTHPFREGNGRTQFQYLKQLGKQAGHNIDLSRFEQKSWIQASIDANRFKSDRMAQCIEQSIADRSRETQSKQKSYVEEQRERAKRARNKHNDRSR
ncbi:MAG: cell division protein [Bacteroidetes bacterium]|nr:MAG: cell division protein [Bacteroidota bacterium]